MISDSELKRRVLEELQRDALVDEAHIGVATQDGSVTLSGHVSEYPEKDAAIDAVKRVTGVSAIADDLVVDVPVKYQLNDSGIANQIARVLQSDVAISGGGIMATVEHGHVILTGEVDRHHQREHIKQQVRRIAGVRAIKNDITLKDSPAARDIKSRIESALQRSVHDKADHISVSVDGDTVTLSGTLSLMRERDLITGAARTAPGVSDVIDKIRIVE